MQSISVNVLGQTYLAQPVSWMDLNTQNLCNPSLGFQKWTIPNELCNSNNEFVLPSEIQGIQASVVLATIFSFFSCSVGFSLGNNQRAKAIFALTSTILAMIFSIAVFSIWSTWGMSQRYRSLDNKALNGGIQAGDYIPLWIIPSGEGSAQIGLSITPISLSYGEYHVLCALLF